MNVHGAATGLESSEEGKVRRACAEIGKIRSSSMDEIQFRQKVKDIGTQELMIEVRLLEFTADNITHEDRDSYKDKLVKIGEEYAKRRDECTSLIAAMDSNDAIDQRRIADLQVKEEHRSETFSRPC